MSHLPVIVGFGGVSPAGRSSFHHGYRRLVIDDLTKSDRDQTLLDLATMMGLLSYRDGKFVDASNKVCGPVEIESVFGPHIRKNTLLRKIIPDLFDVDNVPLNVRIKGSSYLNSKVAFTALKKNLPSRIPDNWTIKDVDDGSSVEIEIEGSFEALFPDSKEAPVKTAGQLPTGFNPGSLYHSANHPRGLQMAMFGACDALNSLGIDWELIKQAVHPDQIGVYAGSGHGQMDDDTGGGGLFKALVEGKRTSSRYLPLSLEDMPSNFINAYIIGNVGHTGTQVAACATFLFNLELAIKEIQLGKRRVAIVGNTEAPIMPEIMEGYKAMGALADDSRLAHYSETGQVTHHERSHSCRPFGNNCGFTLAESAQFVVLFDDTLAMELGAQIHGSIADVFVKADGFKKSISSPGFGNYITLAKAAARLRAILGEKSLRHNSYVSAHGSGTPLNRTTESHGLNETAKAFGIQDWLVTAVKCYLGHPLTPASGDQVIAALGTWKYGLVPGIFTLDEIPEDVHRSHLKFSKNHVKVDPGKYDAAFVNSKGFGGNNGTGLILSPQATLRMLEKKHGKSVLTGHQKKNESVAAKADEYDQKATQGDHNVIYNDSGPVLKESDLNLTDKELKIPGYEKVVDLDLNNPYPDMV